MKKKFAIISILIIILGVSFHFYKNDLDLYIEAAVKNGDTTMLNEVMKKPFANIHLKKKDDIADLEGVGRAWYNSYDLIFLTTYCDTPDSLRLAMFKYFLDRDLPSLTGYSYDEMLFKIVRYGNVKFLKLFLSYFDEMPKVDYLHKIIYESLSEGSDDITIELIKKFNFKVPNLQNESENLLLYAVKYCNYELVKTLIDYGADPILTPFYDIQRDSTKECFLRNAKFPEVYLLLIKNGAKMICKTKDNSNCYNIIEYAYKNREWAKSRVENRAKEIKKGYYYGHDINDTNIVKRWDRVIEKLKTMDLPDTLPNIQVYK